MRIRLAIVCLNYELRMHWMVSSILQQKGDLPEIILDCATLEGDNNPARFPVDLVRERNGRVTLRYFPTEREVFARRGLVRNEQLARAISAGDDWIWFADCDRVYHPAFVSRLAHKLQTRLRHCGKLVTYKWRYSTELEATEKLIAEHRGRAYIPDAWELAHALPIASRRYSLAATGGMQVAKVGEVIKKTGGLYVDPKHPRDKHLFSHGQKANSDLKFRSAMGGSRPIDLPPAVHMEHRRDKFEGHHIEEQR